LRVTLYGRVNEIVVNKILLEDKDGRILLDFSMSYKDRARFYTEPWITPKNAQELLEFGILPRLNGIYKFDNYEKSIDACLLSHAHTDHYKHITFLKRSIDMYCGRGTKVLLDIFNTIRYSNFEHEIDDINWNAFSTKNIIKIGSLEIEPIHVDHSIPASYAFIIHTSNGSIAYTGDLRIHGTRNDLTKDLIKRAKGSDLIAMICEGTNLGKEVVSEDEVYNKSINIISNIKGLAIVGFSLADIDRLRTFYNAAIKNNRALVLTVKQAYLLDKLNDIIDLPHDGIYVYKKGKKRYYDYEEEIFNKYNVLTSNDIKSNQSKYLLILQTQDLRELIEIKPKAGSCYIYSSSEPFNEDSEITFDKFTNWLEHFALLMYHVHASGHIMPLAIRSMLEESKPKMLFQFIQNILISLQDGVLIYQIL